jgi:hypothetical protein
MKEIDKSMNFLGQSILNNMAAAPVVVVAPTFGQLLYSPPSLISFTPLLYSAPLSTSNYNSLISPVVTVAAPFYVQSSGFTTPNNNSFNIPDPGNYFLRYKVGLVSDLVAPQIIQLVLQINGINVEASHQRVDDVSNAGITNQDFEYVFTSTVPNETVELFAKSETTNTTLTLFYLNWNIRSI